MAVSANNSGNLPRPGAVGRLVRLLLGLLLLFFFAQVMRSAPGFLAAQKGWGIPDGDWWIVAAGCFLALSGVVNDGFGRRWGRWPQIVYLVLVVAAAIWDLAVYKVLWAAPLGFVVLLLVLYVLAHAGASFLVSAAVAAPG
jgi:hypothetical protein